MDCKECKTNRKPVESISFIAHESIVSRYERQLKRLWIALILLTILFFGYVTIDRIFDYQFDYADTTTSVDASQEGDGVNIVGGGDIDYVTESEDYNTDESTSS